ncbi:MAG TPA: type II secretion system protein GspM [Rhodospirillales bacterium]|nr:type II secretion system protein GspM [Rhodospirillales bacterium]
MKPLSPTAGRIVALALLVVAIALPYRLIVAPLQEAYQQLRDETASRRDTLARYERLADSRAGLRKRLETLREEPAAQAGYLVGDSETLVAAELQNLVRSIVERGGGRLESTQILTPTTEGAFRRVTLRVRMSADADGLFRILYDLESMLPYLFLEGLDIVSRERRSARAPGQAGAGTLSISYDVFGYMRAG